MTKYLAISAILILSCTSNIYSQNEACIQKLEQAQQLYDQGRIQDIENTLALCIAQNNFSTAEQIQGLKLMALAYLFLEKEAEAEATMLKMLHANHEYIYNETIDPTEFINLYNKFNTKPIFHVGARAGSNYNIAEVVALNGTHSLSTNDPLQSYKPGFGFSGTAVFEYELFNNLYIVPGLNFSIKSYQKSLTKNEVSSSNVLATSNILDNQTWLTLPIVFQYIPIELGKIKPYVSLGGATSYLLTAIYPSQNEIKRTDKPPGSLGKEQDINTDRNRFGLSAQAGIGMKYKIKEAYLVLDLSYNHSFINYIRKKDALNPNNPDILYGLQDAPDIIKQHTVAISLGYTRLIFKPKKLIIK